MEVVIIKEDLGKVNRRASLHVEAMRLYNRQVPILPREKQKLSMPLADNRFFGEGYYNPTENPMWCTPNPIYFPKWKKLKGFQKTK